MLAGGVAFVSSLFLVPLYSSRFIPEHDGKVWSGGSCWADLPIHMHIANSFLHGRSADVSWGGMQSPIFAGEPMAYPFLPDFHAAVLVKIGTTLRWGMMLPGLLLAISLMVLLATFTVRVTGSRVGSVLAILIAVGAGGMGGWNLAFRDGFWNAVNADTAQNDVTGDGKIVWFAFIPHVLLPQRGATFAYPMVMTVLTLVWRATDMRKCEAITNSERRQMLVMAALFAGSLPLIQAHSFIGLGVIIAVTFLLDFHKWAADPRLLVSWGAAGAVAIACGYPQLGLFKHQVESGHGGHFFNVSWWYKNHDVGQPAGIVGFFRFWWMALGPALPFFLLCVALQLWELAQAQAMVSRVKHRGGPTSWTDFYASAVFSEPAPPRAPARSLIAQTQALQEYLRAGPAEGPAGNASAAANDSGNAVASPAPKGRRTPGAGLNASSSSSSLRARTPASSRKGVAASSSFSSLPATPSSFEGAGATAPFAPSSPHAVEVRIEHLEMQYSLPGNGEGVAGQRFKLELPPTTTHQALLHPLSPPPSSSGAGAAPHSSRAVPTVVPPRLPEASVGAGAADSDDDADRANEDNLSARMAPPEGARVATAYQRDAGRAGAASNLAAASAIGGVAGVAGVPSSSSFRDPKAGAYFSEHIWNVAKREFREAFDMNIEDAADPITYKVEAADRALFHLNALSLTGRGFDALKLAIGAFAVFLLGNAVNFQPWDRDNCKLFYIWVFVNACFAGSLLAAPVEYLLGLTPGLVRLSSLAALREQDAYDEALFVAGAAGNKAAAAVHPAGTPGPAPAGPAPAPRVGLPKALYPERVQKAGPESLRERGGAAMGSFASAGALAGIPVLLLLTLTGFMMIVREFGLYHVLLDEDQMKVCLKQGEEVWGKRAERKSVCVSAPSRTHLTCLPSSRFPLHITQVAEFVKTNIPPKAVFVHRDVHITPVGCLSGRPTLVAYNGWMWSHGYNYYDRDRDRNYMLENALKDSDPGAYGAMRR
jgi:hypothetical protein